MLFSYEEFQTYKKGDTLSSCASANAKDGFSMKW